MIQLNYHELEVAKIIEQCYEINVFSNETEAIFTIEEITYDSETTTETGYVTVINKAINKYIVFDFTIKSTEDKSITKISVTESDGGKINIT